MDRHSLKVRGAPRAAMSLAYRRHPMPARNIRRWRRMFRAACDGVIATTGRSEVRFPVDAIETKIS
jgi:hypothetical protein